MKILPTANALTAAIVEAAAYLNARLYRNNSGGVHVAYKDKSGATRRRFVRYGVGPTEGGGGDLIGWTTVTVTPEMVGTKVAVFTSIEIKAGKDRMTDAQKKWASWVQHGGGIAGTARSVDDAVEIMRGVDVAAK